MTKTLLFCDRCRREVDRLYDFTPAELNSSFDIDLRHDLKVELCKDCLRTMFEMEKEFAKGVNFKKRGE